MILLIKWISSPALQVAIVGSPASDKLVGMETHTMEGGAAPAAA